jgi:hypothetical protein
MARKQKKAKKPLPRYQLQQKFWLNALNDGEKDLANWCDGLREKRRFTPVVRKGLTLMRALEAGDIKVLFELFPNLYETLFAQMEADVLERRENEAIHRLGKLEQMIENLSHLPSPAPTTRLGTGGARQLQVKQFAAPMDDDEDSVLRVVTAVADGAEIANNFLRSLGAIG